MEVLLTRFIVLLSCFLFLFSSIKARRGQLSSLMPPPHVSSPFQLLMLSVQCAFSASLLMRPLYCFNPLVSYALFCPSMSHWRCGLFLPVCLCAYVHVFRLPYSLFMFAALLICHVFVFLSTSD